MTGWKALLECGMICRRPTEQERRKVGKVDGLDWDQDLPRIQERCPELLSKAGLEMLGQQAVAWAEMCEGINSDRDQANKMGKWAPNISLDGNMSGLTHGDGSITERQFEYLRSLGVRDYDTVLRSLSKKQASQLIDDVLQLRAANGLPH